MTDPAASTGDSVPERGDRQTPASFTAAERQFLLGLAHNAIRVAVTRSESAAVEPETVPSRLRQQRGCFVTLTSRGKLRGCIGNISGSGPLFANVIQNARSAALRDHRFEPVRPDELPDIGVEISVLTEPRPLDYADADDLLEKLRTDQGVILKFGPHTATYLPQVWEHLPDKVEFLSSLSTKAGCSSDAWATGSARVLVYEVEAFSDEDPPAVIGDATV